MSTLPEHVQIGPQRYTVTADPVEHARWVKADGMDTWGSIKYGLGKIILEPDQGADHMRLALLHEVLHGCWHLTDRNHDADEDCIRRLAGPLLDTLRRNPALVAFLVDEDAGEP